ncbi:hypothetical protein M422DRAFT_275389 [Sphaerobolus stellatus SS14]|uniref:SWIM-type domain-containing protein n=1 Tax=Sphaerobolus stellatus (strain SS14) TaxID=990650 RepID=A0A0C9UES9_SPHS4|nr:hypothetical protein M422DRAFT_275389 [Sphaerobolus stellatus SS14]
MTLSILVAVANTIAVTTHIVQVRQGGFVYTPNSITAKKHEQVLSLRHKDLPTIRCKFVETFEALPLRSQLYLLSFDLSIQRRLLPWMSTKGDDFFILSLNSLVLDDESRFLIESFIPNFKRQLAIRMALFHSEAGTKLHLYTELSGYNSITSCTCQDFQNRGGACKHLRASIIHVNLHRQSGSPIRATPIPETEAEACILHAQVTATQLQTEAESESLGKTPITKVVSFVNDFVTEFAAEVGLEEPEVEAEAEMEVEVAADGVGDDVDDLESVATDARDIFDFTIPKLSARAGIEAQAVGCVFYELEVAAPKFVELAGFLKGAQLPPMQKNRALLCRAPIAMLLIQIDQMLSEVDTCTKLMPRTDPLPKSHPDPSSMASTKRARLSSPPPKPAPLPPSPEKSQKRQQSYSIH